MAKYNFCALLRTNATVFMYEKTEFPKEVSNIAQVLARLPLPGTGEGTHDKRDQPD